VNPGSGEAQENGTDPYQPPRADLGVGAGPDPLIAFPRGDKRWPWLMLILISTVVPFAEVLVFRQPLGYLRGASLIDGLLFLIAIYWWFVVDRREHNFQTGGWQNMGIILLPLVGVPVYLFRSRSWLRGSIATLVALSAAVAFNLLSYFSEELAVQVVLK
jgi:hypothetical protein